MTALFVIIFIDQWEKNKNHLPAILGLAVAGICLMIFGQRNFMLAALLAVSGILLFLREKEEEEK
jgi:4-azaleucine resistance transporter AzlC